MFITLGDTPRPWDPVELAARMASIQAAGRIPSLDLGLRGNQPTPAELAQLADKTYGIDSLVAYTTQFDARIQSFIDVLKAYGKPVMLRLGGEFSGSWNGYHPYAYPVAFRKIVNMFRAERRHQRGVRVVLRTCGGDDFDAVDSNGNAKWYPGRQLRRLVFDRPLRVARRRWTQSQGIAASRRSDSTMRFLDMAVARRRPVVIAESSPMQYNLANSTDATSAWSQWFDPYFGLIATRSEIKWFHYINYDWTKASYYASTGWKNNDMTLSASLSAQYKSELAKPKYLHAGELHLLKK